MDQESEIFGAGLNDSKFIYGGGPRDNVLFPRRHRVLGFRESCSSETSQRMAAIFLPHNLCHGSNRCRDAFRKFDENSALYAWILRGSEQGDVWCDFGVHSSWIPWLPPLRRAGTRFDHAQLGTAPRRS